MKIFVHSQSRAYSVDVNQNDTVTALKLQIEEAEGIPCAEQRLRYNCKTLYNNQQLDHYNIPEYAVLTLTMPVVGGVQILIKNVGKPAFPVEADLSDTVENIKAKIECKEGVGAKDLKLAYKGKYLNDDVCLSSLKFKGTATFLVTKSKTNTNDVDATTIITTTDPTETKSEPTNNSPPEQCLANCGFYGSSQFKGYCSKCFRDQCKSTKEEEKPVVTETPKTVELVKSETEQTDIKKCWKCTRKTGLLGFQCKCKYYFCSNHRYSDKHECTYNYRQEQQTNLVSALTKVEGTKLESM